MRTMQALTEAVMKLAPPGGLFNETVVGNLFPLGSDGARKQLVHRAVASGEISRLEPVHRTWPCSVRSVPALLTGRERRHTIER